MIDLPKDTFLVIPRSPRWDDVVLEAALALNRLNNSEDTGDW